MKELKTITEYQLLELAYFSLLEKISHELEKNEITKKELGRGNLIIQSRINMYKEQLIEVHDRIVEIEHNNAE